MKVSASVHNTKKCAKNKPAMPREKISRALAGPIRIHLAHDFSRFSTGGMAMTITEGVVTQEGKEVGAVRGDAVAPTLHFYFKDRMWTLDLSDIFQAVLDVDKAYQEEARHD